MNALLYAWISYLFNTNCGSVVTYRVSHYQQTSLNTDKRYSMQTTAVRLAPEKNYINFIKGCNFYFATNSYPKIGVFILWANFVSILCRCHTYYISWHCLGRKPGLPLHESWLRKHVQSYESLLEQYGNIKVDFNVDKSYCKILALL